MINPRSHSPPPVHYPGRRPPSPPTIHIAVAAIVAARTIVLVPAATVWQTARTLRGLRDQPIKGSAVEGPRQQRSVVVVSPPPPSAYRLAAAGPSSARRQTPPPNDATAAAVTPATAAATPAVAALGAWGAALLLLA